MNTNNALSRSNHEAYPAVVAARNPNNNVIEVGDAFALVPKEDTSPFFSSVMMKKRGDLIMFKPYDVFDENPEFSILDIINSDVDLNADDNIDGNYDSITEDVLNSLAEYSEEYSPEELIQFISTLMIENPTLPAYDEKTKLWDRKNVSASMIVGLLEILIFGTNHRLEEILERLINLGTTDFDELFECKSAEETVAKFEATFYAFDDAEDDNEDDEFD